MEISEALKIIRALAGYLPERAGSPWRDDEESRLLSEFDSGLSIAEIAENHKRTEGAIRSRLKKLGKIKL